MKNVNLSHIDNLAEIIGKTEDNETIYKINTDKITRDPNQPRTIRDKEKDKKLSANIKVSGVIQPIVLRPYEKGDFEYMIVCGERRFDATIQANINYVPAIIRDIETDDVFIIQSNENDNRDDLHPLDEIFKNAKIGLKLGHEEAAKRITKSRQFISKCIRIFKAPDYIHEFIRLGYTYDYNSMYELVLLDDKSHNEATNIIELWKNKPEARISLRKDISTAKNRLKKNKDNKNKINKNIDNEEINSKNNDNTTDTTLPEKIKSEGKVNEMEKDFSSKIINQNIAIIKDSESIKIETIKNNKILTFSLNNGEIIKIKFSKNNWDNLLNEINRS